MPLVLRVSAESPDPVLIGQAADLIRAGLVVAYPTDTLYGLAVDPRNAKAIQRLYVLKGRPESSALTLIAADMAQVRAAGEMTPQAERLARQWWPGALTIVVRAGQMLAPDMLAGGETVGIRIPDQPVAMALARAAGCAITATSANRSGGAATANPSEIADTLPGIDAIVDAGSARGGPPSTIVDASGIPVKLLRQGVVPWAKVLESMD